MTVGAAGAMGRRAAPWRPEAQVTREDLFGLVEAAPPTREAAGYARFRLTRTVDAATFVRALVPSRPMEARIFAHGQLTDAAGAALTAGSPLRAAEEVTLKLCVTRDAGPASQADACVLYQDPFVLAADKPAGILVHGDGTGADTLTACVQGQLLREGTSAVPQALNRLDVETSGIVLFSLAEETQPAFDALVATGGMRKRYLAEVEGRLPRHEGEWLLADGPIARDRHDARRMRVGKTGKPALTRLRTVEVRGGRSLVEAELGTGRRHQIRVHLSHLGCPIVGDALYGHAARKGSAGLLLHAHELRFVHPLTADCICLKSPLPERFAW